MCNGIFVLSSGDAEEVTQLRIQSLGASADFRAELKAFEWSDADQKHTVFGVRHGGKLVASLRLELLDDYDELESHTDDPDVRSRVRLRAGLVGKSATHPAHRGRGLNGLLRYVALKRSAESGVVDFVSTLVLDAPRTRTLRRLGFTFKPQPAGWRRFGYTSLKPVGLSLLDVPRQAPEVMKRWAAELAPLQAQYPLAITPHAP